MGIVVGGEVGRKQILERPVVETLANSSPVVNRLGLVEATVTAEAGLGVPDGGLGRVVGIEGLVLVTER